MKKFSRRTGVLVLCMAVVFSMAALFTGCNVKQPGETAEGGIAVKVKITDAEQTVLLEEETRVQEDEANAGQAVKNACQSKGFAYQEKDGLYDGFGGVESTKTDGWLFYLNGEQPEVGANDAPVKEGDLVEFRYLNYDEAFAQ